jgi:hypothetical protein
MGAAEGCGSALQVECLEGFDTPGLHQVYAVMEKADAENLALYTSCHRGSNPLAAPILWVVKVGLMHGE